MFFFRIHRLISATEEVRDGTPVYVFEYTIDSAPSEPTDGPPVTRKPQEIHQHTISVVASRGTELYTLTATAPISLWDKEQTLIRSIAKSFTLSDSKDIPQGFY